MNKRLLLSLIAAASLTSATAGQSPVLLDRPPIAYPKSELASQARGFVSVEVQVLADGSVGETRIERSSGNPALDQAALSGVRAWIYRPAQDAAGKPTVAYAGEVVNFDPKDVYESYRLGRILSSYRRFLKTNEVLFEKCAALGVETRAARAAVAPDAATQERAAKLEQRLQDELRAAGHPDAKATVRAAIGGIEDLTSRKYDEMFAAWSKPEAAKHCRETLASATELGFFYPESAELLEF
jgi:periplasmic protein TonB